MSTFAFVVVVVIIFEQTKLTFHSSASVGVGTCIQHPFDDESPVEHLLLLLVPLPHHDDDGHGHKPCDDEVSMRQ